MKDVFGGISCEVIPGISIDIASRRAQQLADDADCEVVFEFNGVRCFAIPGGLSKRLVEEQQRLQGKIPEARSA